AGLILLSALAYAGYLVGGGAVVHRVGSTRFTAIAMMAACAACIAQFFVLRPADHLLVSGEVLGIGAWIAVVGTVLPVWAIAQATATSDHDTVGDRISDAFRRHLGATESPGSTPVIPMRPISISAHQSAMLRPGPGCLRPTRTTRYDGSGSQRV